MGSTSQAPKKAGANRIVRGPNATHCKNGHPRTPENTMYAGPDKKWVRCRICRQECQARYNKNRSQIGDNLKLDPEPFCKWIEWLVEEHGQHGAAFMTGLADRQIQKFLYRQSEGKGPATVRLDTVDAALQRYDGHTTLRDLYPNLYEDS